MKPCPPESFHASRVPIVETLAHEAARTRGRYIGALHDLAFWLARNPSPETVALMLAEVTALDNALQAVRNLLS